MGLNLSVAVCVEGGGGGGDVSGVSGRFREAETHTLGA